MSMSTPLPLPTPSLRVLVSVAAALLLAACSTSATARESRNLMDQYAWKHRPLVILATDSNDPRIATQRQLVAQRKAGFDEREMVLVEGLGPDAKGLRELYDVGSDAFVVLLVGKDTGVKARWSAPVQLARVFAKIDVMPMRRQEIEDRK